MSLQSLRKLKMELRGAGLDDAAMPPLTWLFDCGGMPSDAQLDAFAAYGQGLGPDKVHYVSVISATIPCDPRLKRKLLFLLQVLGTFGAHDWKDA